MVDFPPLLTGMAVAGDPFDAAVAAAEEADPGTVFYLPDELAFSAAVVLAPETPLREAVSVSFAISLGFNDALGALAPPEVGLHLVWPDRFRVNGALCGGLRARASTADPAAVPDWLVIGIDVPMVPEAGVEPGEVPDETCLAEEGCGEIRGPDLIEAWARHMMNWLHIYLTDGFQPLHEDWRARAHALGDKVEAPERGVFVGLDESGGMILKTEAGTRILPLTDILETP